MDDDDDEDEDDEEEEEDEDEDEEEDEEEDGAEEEAETPVIVFKGEKGVATVESGIDGHAECDDFTTGTRETLDAIVAATAQGTRSIIVGEEVAGYMGEFGIPREAVSFVSKGEGCCLKVLAAQKVTSISQLA